MLYDLVAHQAITDVRIELDLLLDQLTPFYQDRMKELAAQEAKVLEIMALLPEGCTPTELAQEARMDRNHVSTLLNRLESAGYIRREPRSRKKTVYIIPERFFRIWHQMSHSRSARGRVQYLLEFFSTWYATRVERDQVWNELVANFQRRIEHSDEEQMESVPALIERLKDESDDVRGSAAAALGRMGMEGKIPGLKEVAMALIETSDERQGSQLRRALTLLLRSAFRSGNLEMARAVVDGVASSLPDGEALCAPHQVALAYLDADRDPAILERQHPEVREAVYMLVYAFDQEREG
jgi:DNA-binding transcriptional ArsR family regulator